MKNQTEMVIVEIPHQYPARVLQMSEGSYLQCVDEESSRGDGFWPHETGHGSEAWKEAAWDWAGHDLHALHRFDTVEEAWAWGNAREWKGHGMARVHGLLRELLPIQWLKVATSGDLNVMRAEFKGCDLETDVDRTWLHITHPDHGGDTVQFSIEDGKCVFENCTGIDFSEDWTGRDWEEVEASMK